jgi:hypothetical protein
MSADQMPPGTLREESGRLIPANTGRLLSDLRE